MRVIMITALSYIALCHSQAGQILKITIWDNAKQAPAIRLRSLRRDNGKLLIPTMINMIDGLMMTGGQDINPLLYDEDHNINLGCIAFWGTKRLSIASIISP